MRTAFATGHLPRITDPLEVKRVLDALEWVVYSKPGRARTDTIIDDLVRDSHRIALSDRRLRAFDGETVDQRCKDYRDHDRRKVMALSGEELLRRFLLQVLPPGFKRVRHFGFLANRCCAARLATTRTALAAPPPAPAPESAPATVPLDGDPCPTCGTWRLRTITHLAPHRRDGGWTPAAGLQTGRTATGGGACVHVGDPLSSIPPSPDRQPFGVARMVMCRLADPPLSARAAARGPSARPDRGYVPLSIACAPPTAGTAVVAD